MSGLQWLGAVLIASPFVAMFIYSVRVNGARATLGLFGAIFAFVAVVTFASMLLTGAIA